MEYILKTDYHCEFTISSIQRNVIVDGITTVDPTVDHSTISNIDVISIMSLRPYINEMANTTMMLNVSKQYPQYLIYSKLHLYLDVSSLSILWVYHHLNIAKLNSTTTLT